MRSRFLLLAVMFLVVLTSFVAAESLISIDTISNEITPLEVASYKLSITNNAPQHQRYTLYSLQSGQGWSLEPVPFKDKIVDLAPGEKRVINVTVRPLEAFSPGIYFVPMTVESDLGERHNTALKLYLSPEKPIDYLPSITATIDMDDNIDPRNPLSIKLFLENRNPLDLQGLTIRLQSEMPEFMKEVTVNLPPLDKKTVEFTVTPSQYQQPGKKVLFFVFERDDQVVKVIDQHVNIQTILDPFTVAFQDETVFFKVFRQVTITNGGNTVNTQEVGFPSSIWQTLFVQGEEGITVLDGSRHVSWELELKPGESVVKDIIINYRLIFYVLVLILIMVIFYLVVKSPVQLNKKAVTKKSDEEGALSEIKITLEVRNTSSKTLKHVEIVDIVPAIANVEKNIELGTLKPKEIKHTKKGTKVVWELAELDGHDHRLVTYNVKAKLNILGTFSLPRATISFKKGTGKKRRKAYSNIFRLGN
jgi:multisubunit Na+/H+ antiporter MnhE subunit